MSLKKEVLWVLILLILTTAAYALCTPIEQACGCGGIQRRSTLPDGSCSAWTACSVNNLENLCNDQTDDDCDGLTDCADSDCAASLYCRDNDNDGYAASVDCNDNNANINPGKAEICNGIDDNCNNQVDEQLTRSCGTDTGICQAGTETCIDSFWQGCTAVQPTNEICDNLDNDCDGQTDEGCSCTNGQTQQCGSSNIGACQYGTQTCTNGQWQACTNNIEPSTEVCNNNIDDDCDGQTDEGCQVDQPPVDEPIIPPEDILPDEPVPELYQEQPQQIAACVDQDGDGYGMNCALGPDCNDGFATVNPAAAEICNNVDDNCNNQVDENLRQACGSDIGICQAGTETCTNGQWQACTAIQSRTEICYNNLDDDCDGNTDENCQPLSQDEKTLKFFLEKEYAEPDLATAIADHQKTARFTNIKKSSKIVDGKTTINIKIIPIQTLKDVSIYEAIPKSFAENIDEITFATQPKVIEADPLIVWHFAELSEPVDLSYEVDKEIEDAEKKTQTFAHAADFEEKKSSLFMLLAPLGAVPVIIVIIIFFARFAKKE